MKKVLTLLVAFLAVFTLSACTDEEAMTNLQDSIDSLTTQLNTSDTSVADLEAAKDALETSVAALQAELDTAKADNTAMAADITKLQTDLDAAQLTLVASINSLSTQLGDVTATLSAQLVAVSADFQAALDEANVAFNLALDESNASLAELQAALDASNEVIDGLLQDLAVYELPIIYGNRYYTVDVYESVVPVLKGFDIQDGDVTSGIEAASADSFDYPGEYLVTYQVLDSDGHVGTLDVIVTVVLDTSAYAPANYLSGVDLSKLDADNKGRLFAALERYLLDNVYGGVPLYTGASRVMYSDRVSLFSPDYNGVMGFGTAFSEFTEDDSNVLLYGDTYGNAGEYTWRASYRTDPTSLNPWTADDSNSSDFIDLFTGSLYTFYFDATKTGYEILPDLASGEPIPVNPEVINGKTYATIWDIPVRTDLEWTFHPDTDTSGFAAGFETLDASDYLWTWEYALTNTWFRAVSGGGDFITSGIKGAAACAAAPTTCDFTTVGMSETAEGNIRLEYTTDKSAFDIKYGLANSWTPINEELFMAAGATYGTTPETVAASGIYMFDEWTSGQFLSFVKNDNHPHADMYNYTGQQFRYIETDEQTFEEFLAGRLESSSIPSARIDEFVTDPRVKVAPAATTWRLMINGFGDEATRDEYITQYPEFGLADDFVPEPILAYTEMRKALYYGFDRYEAAVNVVKTYLPAFTLFASTYFLDAESGISVRGTDAGADIVTSFGGSDYAYSPDAAVAYFRSAVTQAIAAGEYEAGTPSDYTTIEFSLTYASSGNTGAQNMVAQIEQQYEALLVDDTNYVNVDIVVADVEFPTNYYNFMMVANTDLGIGGISGSLLDAPSFLDVFNDDNVSGFTLNWGIDTHSVNVPVVYNNLEGTTVYEIWAYNALVAALNGKEYIQNGVEQTVFDSLNGLIDAYVDMSGSSVASSTDGADLAQYVLGSTVAEIATDEGYDNVFANIVVTTDGDDILFVVAESEGGFELLAQHALFKDAKSAIGAHSGYAGQIDGDPTLLDDAGVAADAYIQGLAGGTLLTVADVAAYSASPAAYTEVYAISWDFGDEPGDKWSDAYVVVHIGEYFIGWEWI